VSKLLKLHAFRRNFYRVRDNFLWDAGNTSIYHVQVVSDSEDYNISMDRSENLKIQILLWALVDIVFFDFGIKRKDFVIRSSLTTSRVSLGPRTKVLNSITVSLHRGMMYWKPEVLRKYSVLFSRFDVGCMFENNNTYRICQLKGDRMLWAVKSVVINCSDVTSSC
jgi:hypothetical protein